MAPADPNLFTLPRHRATPCIAALLGLALATTALVTPAHATTVYRCTDGQGRVAFSGNPCGTGADRLEVTDSPSNGVGIGIDGDFSETVRANRERAYDRDVARHKQRIRALLRQRDDRLATLRARQSEVSKTRKGAANRRLIAAEIRSVTNDYNARVRLERDRLTQLGRP
jgi:hypothetical protein